MSVFVAKYGAPFPPQTTWAPPPPLPPDDSTVLLHPGDKIYVAARFERQAEARSLAIELVRAGYTVTSWWLHAPSLAIGNPVVSERQAKDDLNDLDGADVYLLLSDDVLGRGGKDFEGGYAFARGKRCIVVGPPAHIFHFLPGVRRIPTLEEFRFLYLNGEKIDSMEDL
jgi:hypothetical protein